jgi:hypothetical protein
MTLLLGVHGNQILYSTKWLIVYQRCNGESTNWLNDFAARPAGMLRREGRNNLDGGARHRPSGKKTAAILMSFSSNSWISWPHLAPVLMLLASNVFMTFAWYGHLNFKSHPLWVVVLASWAIAFFEYWLAVPANRMGHAVYSAAELKTMQEVITFVVFIAFSVLFLKEAITLKHVMGFALIALGATVVFRA